MARLPKKKIVILGGGPGGLSAAWHLTCRPDWNTRYDVVLYQVGWRLGGKIASGRNARHCFRNEEHGLHCWFGFYQNAFRMLRECYAELARIEPGSYWSFDTAFKGADRFVMTEEVGGTLSAWPIHLPPRPGRPGDPDNPEPDSWDVVRRLIHTAYAVLPGRSAAAPALAASALSWFGFLAGLRQDRPAPGTAGIVRTLRALRSGTRQHATGLSELVNGAAQLRDEVRSYFEHLDEHLGDAADHAAADLRRASILSELCLTAAKGIVADGLLFRSMDSIDHLEFSDWLRRHGAAEAAVASNGVRAIYDACFAFKDGDFRRRNLAAGAGLAGAIRLALTYFGYPMYSLRAGIGEAVVAPLYRVLVQRGVQFRFFHKVERLRLGADARRVSAIVFDRQVQLAQDGYDPLIEVPGCAYPCWPTEPKYELIRNGGELRDAGIDLQSHWAPRWRDAQRFELQLGEQDQVVIGMPPAALRPVCEELTQASPAWHRLLVEPGLPSVQTFSAQLWLNADRSELGGPASTWMVSSPEPLDVWADMTPTIREECWPAAQRPRMAAYFVGPLPGDLLRTRPLDPAAPAEALAQARRATVDWLQAYGTVAWPHAAAPGGGFDWNRLHVGASGAAASGEARLDQQYLRANVEPSERYVLAPPVLNRLRLPPDRSGFDNLVLAGDWTRTAVNAGCVEAAVMSGMAASRALCGYPSSIFGERFLSPERATPAIPAPAGNPGRRVEVTILGGGCAAMSTAFWLTSTEELRRRYKVTVYTQSWRLGGKGASGRDENNRIEEHGLHVMLGFYATVFRTMERCYDELAACKEFTALDKPAFRSWHEALTPQTEFMLWLRWPPAPDQPLVPWPVSFPQPLVAAGEFPDPVGVVAAIGAWLRTASVGLQEALRPALLLAGWAAERIESLAAPAVALYSLLLQPLSDRFSELAHDIGQLHLQIERQLADLGGMGAAIAHGVHAVEDGVRQDLYKLQLIQSCGLALARGLVEDVILGPGFDALNHLDFKDWLRSHGATPEAATCPLVMAFYDLAFAYPDGDSSRPENGRAAAGAALRLILRMLFGYSGAPAYKMRASMGETIFTPLYLVLKKRGVDFRFLSRVDKLSLSPDHSRIGSVTFRQSPELHAHYDPLIDVTFDDGSRWPCWPNQARAPRAAAGAEDPWGPPQGEGPQLTLAIGKEDKVVLAIPPAAAAHLTAELTRWTPGWREMLAGARSVATLSQQLWYEQTSAELGHRPVIATGFADPLRSWGDMSQVLHAEPQVPGNVAVRSCHYLCGTYAPPAGEPLPTPGPRPGYLEGQQAHAAAQAQQWMQKWAAALWPGVAPERLLAPVHAYSQLNLAHSEQYVLSLPGTIASRLAPGGSGCANLYLAGDWTRTSIDGSCAEAAFESGLQAAAAICGIPARTLLEGL